jgi:hypothetical protein
LNKALKKRVTRPANKHNLLPETRQDTVDDKKWDRKFAASQGFLETLAEEGNAEYEAGRTRRLKI